ncbi:MAG: endonuclease domain-containing protein [Flavobacteriaceae bacterium]
MKRRKIIPYNPNLKEFARQLRNNSTKAEIILWQKLKRKQMYGYDFHRQKPIDNYIVDFFCHELMLAIEVDGYSHQFEEVYDKDVRKTQRLNELGVYVLRFTDNEVLKEMFSVMLAIENYITEFEKQEEHTPNPSQEGSPGSP